MIIIHIRIDIGASCMRKLSRKAGLTEMKKAGKQRLFIAAGILILAVTGCGRKTQENHDMPQQAAVKWETGKQEHSEISCRFMGIYKRRLSAV